MQKEQPIQQEENTIFHKNDGQSGVASAKKCPRFLLIMVSLLSIHIVLRLVVLVLLILSSSGSLSTSPTFGENMIGAWLVSVLSSIILVPCGFWALWRVHRQVRQRSVPKYCVWGLGSLLLVTVLLNFILA